MKAGESEKTTIAKKTENQDITQNFIEENILDEEKLESYKGYKKYVEWVDQWLPLIWTIDILALVAVAIIEDYLYGSGSSVLVEPFSYVFVFAFAAPLLLGTVSQFARWYSEIDAEQVAYHEIASAFQLYRQNTDNIEPVLDRISNSLGYFDTNRFNRLDSKRLEDAERYLKKVDDASDPVYISDEFHGTFPQFMRELSLVTASTSESEFSKLAKDMDSAYTGEMGMKERLKTDIKKLVQFVLTGPELIITLSSLALIWAVYSLNIQLATAIGIFGVVFSLYTHYQNRG